MTVVDVPSHSYPLNPSELCFPTLRPRINQSSNHPSGTPGIVSDIHLLTYRLPHLHTIITTLSPLFYSARYPYLSNFGIYIIYMSFSRLGHMHLRSLVSVRICCCIVAALANPYSIGLSFSTLPCPVLGSRRACACAKADTGYISSS
ncbi:hypothetical protein C8Q74DRAFT_1232081 [Fomes fomentarius]|nr:hypothetical protein C8Q74DRAFT_1312680 [Fomes fomentarius]KAI0808237.1 hypothetical protein C8Q74DRAFT_1232081 [Fomes fomentarius]